MKYLALGILQDNFDKSDNLGFTSFEEWKLLYYIPRNTSISVREQIRIHFHEVHKVFEKHDVLPFGFGCFIENEEGVISLLKNNRTSVSEEWNRISNTAELRLTFEESLIQSTLPERLISEKTGISFWQEKYLQNARVRHFLSVLKDNDKSQITLDSKTKVQGKNLIFDFLIRKKDDTVFYRLLAETLQRLNIVRHELSRPTAPFNFVKLTLKK